MTPEEARDQAVEQWWQKADDALACAQSELAAARLENAVNRLHYACFFALTGLLLAEGHSYRKHTALQAALHRDLIATGRLTAEFGRLYDQLMEARAKSDYTALTEFEPQQVRERVGGVARFVAALGELQRQ